MNRGNVAIIILNYNGYQDTIECLESLGRISYQDFQVVLVDNASTDDSVARLRQWLSENKNAAAKVHLVENEKNYGYARGNNVGIKYALANFGSEYTLILNNDTSVEPDFLQPLIEGLRERAVALAGPRIIESGVKYHWQGYLPSRINFLNYLAFLTPLRQVFIKTPLSIEFNLERSESPRPAYSIPGCCMLFRSGALESVGLFDEKTFLGWEECIIAEKLFQAGYRTVVVPKSRIFHKVSRGFAKISLLTRKDSYQESERYFQLNYLKMPSYQRRLIGLIRSLSHFLTVLSAGSAEKKAGSIQ
ncbi:MAG: glycosyltransferase family 2 protein [Candidatus Margulisbacteria bacterium]|nr:glycosyltransferase family 2 protein [Candidatus Margulisiibacteriota bacterium]